VKGLEVMKMCRQFIFDCIRQIVFDEKHNNWSGKFLPVASMLNQLEPGAPEDNICGFLAYNVPGKDRMKMKTGRFLTRKLSLNSGFLSDQQISKLTEKINYYLFPAMQTRLDSGSAITENYRNAVGGHSCMTGGDAECTGLYAENPEKFQQLIMLYNGNSARAIIHKLDNGQYLMDRIYSDSEALKEAMFEYADKNNWAYRMSTTAGQDAIIGIDYDACIVSGLNYTDGEVPYMDTLINYCIANGTMAIFHRRACYSADGALDQTNGCIGGRFECTVCGYDVTEDDVRTSEDGNDYCESCYCERFCLCDKCGEECYTDDLIEIQDKVMQVCKECAEYSFFQCDKCDDYFSETFPVDNESQDVCSICLERDYTRCDRCGEYFSCVNDAWHCKECAGELEKEVKPVKTLAFVDRSIELTGELFNNE